MNGAVVLYLLYKLVYKSKFTLNFLLTKSSSNDDPKSITSQ